MTTDTVAATRRTCELLGIDRVRRGLPAFTARREGDPCLTCFIGEACGGTAASASVLWRTSLDATDQHSVSLVFYQFEHPEARPIIHHAVLAWLAEQEALEAVTQPVPDVRTVGL